jgi:predicted RNA-binding protein with PIN domain
MMASVCPSVLHMTTKKKKTLTCHQSMMIMLFLLLVFDAFQTHKNTKKQNKHPITIILTQKNGLR